jgi:hypothetical protein
LAQAHLTQRASGPLHLQQRAPFLAAIIIIIIIIFFFYDNNIIIINMKRHGSTNKVLKIEQK